MKLNTTNRITHTFFGLVVSISLFSCSGDSPEQASPAHSAEGNNSSIPSPSEPAKFSTAHKILEEQCTNCHMNFHKAWEKLDSETAWIDAKNNKGESLLNMSSPAESRLLKRIAYYGAATSNMPLDNTNQSAPFTLEDYETLQSWVEGISERQSTKGGGEISITQVQLDEKGLHFRASCNSSRTLQSSIHTPSNYSRLNLSDFEEITSRADGIKVASSGSVASEITDSIQLVGMGDDIWDGKIYFNGLRRTVNNGELDLTVTLSNVEGLEHDFAKIGIMASSTDDLSGELLFLHWAGRTGMSEDSGSGALNTYRQLLENPNSEGGATPTPATMRLTYTNEQFQIGTCYNCSSPSLAPSKTISFTPKTVFIVASSHHSNPLQAQLKISDAYSPSTTTTELASSQFVCDSSNALISISLPELKNLEQLSLNISHNGESVFETEQERTYSQDASCALQDALLKPKIRRLSQTQIINSVNDIFGDLFDSDIWPDMADGARLIGMNFGADKLGVNNINMEQVYNSSRAIVSTLLTNHSDIKPCAKSNSADCVSEIMTQYGSLVWRRPILSEESDALFTSMAGYNNNSDKLEFLLNSFLLSSNFLFRKEIGSVETNLQTLDNYERVSLLSFSIWNSSPDQTLLSLAAQKTPLSNQQIRTQVERMMQDKRTTTAMVEIYKDYLKLELVLSRDKDPSFNFTDRVRQDLLSSAEMTLANKLQSTSPYMNVFKGNDYFINNNIATFFNTSVDSESLSTTALSSAQRYGLLNHPAFLSVHSTLAQSGIVKRGVFTLEQLLCEELPAPPDSVMPVPAPDNIVQEETSERDLLQITHSSQAGCVGCHYLIDPAGFGYENFDAVGRYRTVEKKDVPIDSSGVLEVGDATLTYNNGAEYAQQLVSSSKMKQCVSRRFLEHFLGQDLDKDSCELKKFQLIIEQSNGDIQSLISALTQLESFKTRALGK